MKKFMVMVMLVIALMTALWFQAEPNLLSYDSVFEWRTALVQYSGIMSITLMSVVMLLALRLPILERLTKGLDKSYRIHKYLGIAAVLSGVMHWLLAIVPKKMVQAGLLEKPIRGAGPTDSDSLYALIQPLRSFAEEIGEWAFYAVVLLAIIALIGIIRYKGFRLSHKLMSVAFLVFAAHAAILIKQAYWAYPITYLILLIATVGSLAALYSLFGRIGKHQQHTAKLSHFNYFPNDKVIDLSLSVPTWRGHQSGQFAFVSFPGEEPHPFSIASADTQKGQLRFLIKELGDFTSQLKNKLYKGEEVRVEGPYGGFDFNYSSSQVWIAGGIGIAAFEAILQQRQAMPNPPEASLYYCSETIEPEFIAQLKQQAEAAGVKLKVIDNRVQAWLTAVQLQQEVEDLLNRKIWFCGPVAFSKSLQGGLNQQGFNLDHFHYELFNMR